MTKTPGSLLSKVLGIYRVAGEHTAYFQLSLNVFHGPVSAPLTARYELKGSANPNRKATASEAAQRLVKVGKDLDFSDQKQVLRLGPKKADFVKRLQADTEVGLIIVRRDAMRRDVM